MNTSQMLKDVSSEDLRELLEILNARVSLSESLTELLNTVIVELSERGEVKRIVSQESQKFTRLLWETEEETDEEFEFADDVIVEIIQNSSSEDLITLLRKIDVDHSNVLDILVDELIARSVAGQALPIAAAMDELTAEDILRDLILPGTSEELTHMLKELVTSDKVVREQAQLLYDIAGELRRRGVTVPYEDGELWKRYAELMLNADTAEEAVMREAKEKKAARAAEPEQKKSSRMRWAAACIAGTVIFMFLVNFISTAGGYDIFSRISGVTKDAIAFVTGGSGDEFEDNNVSIQYMPLRTLLEDRNIQVDIPTRILEGFIFHHIEPAEPDEYSEIASWFTRGEDGYSLTIIPISIGASTSHSEVNPGGGGETYKGRFLITENMDRAKAIWYDGIYRLEIQGDLTAEQLKQLLDSV